MSDVIPGQRKPLGMSMIRNPENVIPAQVGTAIEKPSALCWIPAAAGMTPLTPCLLSIFSEEGRFLVSQEKSSHAEPVSASSQVLALLKMRT